MQGMLVRTTEHCAGRIVSEIKDDLHGAGARAKIAAIIEENDHPTLVVDSAGVPLAWTRTVTGMRGLAGGSLRFTGREPVTIDEVRKSSAFTVLPLKGATDVRPTGFLIYSRNRTARLLSWLSLSMAALLVGFVAFMTVSFRRLRLSERSNLWVALAKETAHQLGTPITALMGWVEYLRTSRDQESSMSPEELVGQIEKICGEMDNDVRRLCKISSRFSQIGSVPVLEPADINAIIDECVDYFNVRLPLMRRKIELRKRFGELPLANVNHDLLEWVFENLIKNSLDAIHRQSGKIEIRTEYLPAERIVRIYHADNGRGVPRDAGKKIFSPGFTTKTRGWGLGLTLAKRIIEDYHQGKIYVHWTKRDKGTVFCVDLPLDATPGKSRGLTI
jgi:signal transduction histidine kinase